MPPFGRGLTMFELFLNCIAYTMYYAFVALFWVAIFKAGRAVFGAARSLRYAQSVGFCAIIVALLWGGLFVGLTPGASFYARYRYSRELFGSCFALWNSKYSYHSPRHFNGDGYSIEVLTTSDALSRWATAPPSDFGKTHPVLPSFRSHWSAIHWRATPVGADELKFLEFALMRSDNSSDLDAAKKFLERLANEPGHYFACFYFMHDSGVGNVDFFLLSPSERVLILVNHNT